MYGFRIKLLGLLRRFDVAVALFPHLPDEFPKIGNQKCGSYIAITIEGFLNWCQWSIRSPMVRGGSFESWTAIFLRTEDTEEFANPFVTVREEKYLLFAILEEERSTRQGFWPIPFAFISGIDNVWILHESGFHGIPHLP